MTDPGRGYDGDGGAGVTEVGAGDDGGWVLVAARYPRQAQV